MRLPALLQCLLLTPAVEEAGDRPLLLQAVHLRQLRALAHTVLPGLGPGQRPAAGEHRDHDPLYTLALTAR